MDSEYTHEILNKMRIEELKQVCLNNNIHGYNHISKNELVILIMNKQNNKTMIRSSLRKNVYNNFMSIMKRLFCETDENITHPEFEDIEEENIEKQCVICFVNRRIFAGKCGHLVLCGKCSNNVYKQTESLCPMCRNSWKDVRKIFI